MGRFEVSRRFQTIGFKSLPLIALIIAAFTVSCTRNSDTSSVRFEMPDWQKTIKSNGKIGTSNFTIKRLPARIMINITGPGIEKPIVEIWNTNTAQTPPSSFEFTVPKGSGRLIQVLAVTRDFYLDSNGDTVSDGMESFFYGDVMKDLSNPTESVEISLTNMSLGEAGLGEGVITGRYLDENGSGPTAKVNIFFKPPTNAPPMLVAQDEIHGGWFEFFRIDGVNFYYLLEDGRPLFKDFSIENPGFNWDASKALFRYPQGWTDINGDPDNGRKPVPPRHVVVGYFGPGAEGKKICVPNTGELRLYTEETGSTLVTWAGKKENLAATEAGVTHGGVDAEQCADGTWLEDWLFPHEGRLGSTHEAMGFYGAFQQMTDIHSQGNTAFVMATYNEPETNKLSLQWRYLPGVTGPGRIAGVEVFSRVLPSDASNSDRRDYQGADGILCGELTNQNRFSNPFTFVKAVPYDSETLEHTLVISGITQNEWDEGRVQFVLCPYNEKNQYFSNAAVAFNSYWGPSGGPPGPAISADLLAFSGGAQLLNGICHEVLVKMYDQNNNVINLPSGHGVDVNVFISSGYGVTLHSDGDTNCLGTGSSTQTVHLSGGGQAIGKVRVKAGASSSSVSLFAEVINPGVQVNVISAYNAPISKLYVTARTNNGTTITSGGCVPVQFVIDQPLPVNANLKLTSITGSALQSNVIYSSSSDCSSETNGLTTTDVTYSAATQQSANYYVKLKDPVDVGTNFEFQFDKLYPAVGGEVALSSQYLNISCATGECLSPIP